MLSVHIELRAYQYTRQPRARSVVCARCCSVDIHKWEPVSCNAEGCNAEGCNPAQFFKTRTQLLKHRTIHHSRNRTPTVCRVAGISTVQGRSSSIGHTAMGDASLFAVYLLPMGEPASKRTRERAHTHRSLVPIECPCPMLP